MKKIISSLLLPALIILTACGTAQKENKETDITLVIPGKSAEGFSVNDTFSPEQNSIDIETSLMPEPLLSFLKEKQIPPFTFNRIIYLRNRYALFTDKERVRAIAGLNPVKRITDDAVELAGGVDNFIFNYGNSGLEIITDEDHKIYIYRKLGIALFDDNSNDSIDMYLIFTPE